MPHIESDIEILPLTDAESHDAGAGKILMRPKLNKSPSPDWQKLFAQAVVDHRNALVANAGLSFENKTIQYVTDASPLSDRKFEEIKKLFVETNRLASEHNAKEDASRKENLSKAEADKNAFEAYKDRMRGK